LRPASPPLRRRLTCARLLWRTRRLCWPTTTHLSSRLCRSAHIVNLWLVSQCCGNFANACQVLDYRHDIVNACLAPECCHDIVLKTSCHPSRGMSSLRQISEQRFPAHAAQEKQLCINANGCFIMAPSQHLCCMQQQQIVTMRAPFDVFNRVY